MRVRRKEERGKDVERFDTRRLEFDEPSAGSRNFVELVWMRKNLSMRERESALHAQIEELRV